MPNCDVTGQMFLESAHIKPDNVDEDGTPHRAHILNGLCLCRHCHIAFDRGYFSLTDNHRIITSTRFSEIVDQNLKTVILSSNDLQIKNRVDNRLPLVEFIQYHRTVKFHN
jgi:predicted restriction endonuclease